MSDNNKTAEEKQPEKKKISPQQKAELEARKESGQIFISDTTFFVMTQVGIIQDGDFQINAFIEGGRITGFNFSMNGKRLYRPFAPEEKQDA